MANLNVQVIDGNNLNVQVTPVAQTQVVVSRGLVGPAGPNAIGGFPININSASNYDALMFVSNEWINVNQLEIADGGNF
jgi:hypothetical protein